MVRFHEGRLALALVVLALYTGASAWIVHGQANRYRQAVIASRGRSAAHPVILDTRKPGPARTSPSSEPPSDPREDKNAMARPAGPEAPTQPTAPAKSAEIAASASVKPSDSVPRVAQDQDRPTVGKSVPLPKHDPFWDSPEMKQVYDVEHLDADAERAIGEKIHAVVLRFHPTVMDGAILARIQAAADPFLEAVKRKDVTYTFTVLDSDAINAFSHLGGYVYVTRGLLNLIGDDEDYMLQFVVGHEIAHVDLRHTVKCLSDAGVRQLGLGTIGKVYLIIIPFAYLDAQDYEADHWVANRMSELDCSPFEVKAFLRRYERYAQEHGFAGGRATPQVGRDSSPLDNHFRAHVSPRSRLQRLIPASHPGSRPTK